MATCFSTILSGSPFECVKEPVEGARESPRKNFRNESIADKFAFSNLGNSDENVAKTNDKEFSLSVRPAVPHVPY